MTETELILEAISTGIVNRVVKKKLKIQEFDSSPADYDPVIRKLAKKLPSNKKKSIRQWSNTDFLRYIKTGIESQGLIFETAGLRDRDTVGKIYDNMVIYLQDKMDNHVLKNYFDWWVSERARLVKQQIIYTSMICSDVSIETFMKQFYKEEPRLSISTPPVENKDTPTDYESLYNLGGLSMILLSGGIVVTYNLLKSKNEDRFISKISNALKSMNKDTLVKVMDITLKNKYTNNQVVDFMSIAQPSLRYHKISKYVKTNYKEFFV